MRNPFGSTGMVVRRGDDGYRFIGTCFAFRSPAWFLTAGHVVREAQARDVGVALYLNQNVVEEGLPVSQIYLHPEADVAVLRLAMPDLAPGHPLRVFDPFRGIGYIDSLGISLRSFGFPEQAEADGVVPVPRLLRGHLQRQFSHTAQGTPYSALELSYPVPAGMSGSPVSPDTDQSTVVGVLASDYKSRALLHEEVVMVGEDGQQQRVRYEAVVTYGIAVDLTEESVSAWLDGVLATHTKDADEG